jgi:hypothetical protein
MAKKKSKKKVSVKPKPKQTPKTKSNSPWSFVIYFFKSLPWWIIKFIDWIFTIITATIVYLLT